MLAGDVIRSWGRILSGYRPELAVEITRDCPLHCAGCYAYASSHVGDGRALRSVADLRGRELVDGVLGLVAHYRPLHVSVVGGEPLLRDRELDVLLPRLTGDGIHVQVVTSAVKPIPSSWQPLPRLNISVSIDGLPAEHDARRKPATYDRVLRNIDGHKVSVHCTITRQQMRREGYLEEFVRFWSGQECAKRIWMSLYTPQIGEVSNERLTPDDRVHAVEELQRLRMLFPKLDMGPGVLRQLTTGPSSPGDCEFARLATCISADLRTPVTPCQLGGSPDCSQCGCMAAAGVGAVARTKLLGVLPLSVIVTASQSIGRIVRRVRNRHRPASPVGVGSGREAVADGEEQQPGNARQ